MVDLIPKKTNQEILDNSEQQKEDVNIQKNEDKSYGFKTYAEKKRNNLLDTLVEKGILTKDQIKVAETQATKTGDSIIDVLIQLNFITDSVIHNILKTKMTKKIKLT